MKLVIGSLWRKIEMGHLSTHVLDTARGRPAEDVVVEVHALNPSGSWDFMNRVSTNATGRTDQPLLAGDQFRVGTYMLTFHIGSYFRRVGLMPIDGQFLDLVPLRFSVTNKDGLYHVPLVASPWSYATYRGS